MMMNENVIELELIRQQMNPVLVPITDPQHDNPQEQRLLAWSNGCDYLLDLNYLKRLCEQPKSFQQFLQLDVSEEFLRDVLKDWMWRLLEDIQWN